MNHFSNCPKCGLPDSRFVDLGHTHTCYCYLKEFEERKQAFDHLQSAIKREIGTLQEQELKNSMNQTLILILDKLDEINKKLGD